MAYENECDTVLKIIEALRYKELESVPGGAKESSVRKKAYHEFNIEPSIVEIVVSILVTDGCITKGGDSNLTAYYLTHYGIKFLYSNSYVLQKENWLTEAEHRKLSTLKLKQDLRLNNWLLKTKWLPHILAISGLAISIFAYRESRKEHDQKPNNQPSSTTIQSNK